MDATTQIPSLIILAVIIGLVWASLHFLSKVRLPDDILRFLIPPLLLIGVALLSSLFYFGLGNIQGIFIGWAWFAFFLILGWPVSKMYSYDVGSALKALLEKIRNRNH